MTSTGSVLLLALCLRLRRLWDKMEGTGAEGVATERERWSVKRFFVGPWDGSLALHSLSVSWRHLSKQPAVKVWWLPK